MRSLFAISLAFTLIVTGPPRVAAAAMPVVYLALGDSLAVGVGASNIHTTYVSRLFQYYRGAAQVDTLVNLGVSGETSSSLLGAQLTNALAAISDPATDVRVVTLDIGGNDLLNALFGAGSPCRTNPTSPECQAAIAAALATFAASYGAMLVTLSAELAADPGTEQIYVMTYYNLWGGTGDPLEAVADMLLLGADLRIDCVANLADLTKVGLNDLIACIATASGAIVADVYGAFDDRALVLTHVAEGDIHPTDAGYAAIAKAFMDAEKGK